MHSLLSEWIIRSLDIHSVVLPDRYDPGPGALQVFDIGGSDVRGTAGELVPWEIFLRQHTLVKEKTQRVRLILRYVLGSVHSWHVWLS